MATHNPDLENGKQAASHASDLLAAVPESVKEAAQQAAEEVTGFVRKNPALAIAAGFGLGFLVAKLLSRRD